MEGAIDVDALRRALSEIVRRHDVLRTTFGVDDGKPYGTIHPSMDIELPVSRLPREGRDAAVLSATTVENTTPFDLARGPLFRARLLSFGDDDHVLVAGMHHIVSDVWARAVLNREISALYDAYKRGEPSPLPELAIQYADYAAWQREWLSGERLDAQLAYWRAQLDDAPRLIELPTDRPRPPVRSYRGARVKIAIPAPLTKALRDLARREGATLYMVLLAALDVLLHRYTGQSDIVVGSPVAGRTRAETEELLGFFLSTLVMRAEVDSGSAFRELLAKVKATCLGAYAHQDMPFERLVSELDTDRDLSRSPLFQVIFNLQNVPRDVIELPGATARGVQIDTASTKYDLSLILADGPSVVAGNLYYSTDLFDAPTIERMAAHLLTLLEGVVKAADKPIRDLPMLLPAEREQLVTAWNATTTDFPLEETLIDLFEAQADKTPSASALVAGGERLTFQELDARSNRLARHLRKLGVSRDVVVGLLLPRSADIVVSILGVLKAGGAYVPIDPAYPAPRVAQILAEARSPVLVTRGDLQGSFDGVALCRLDDDRARIDEESDARLAVDIASSDLAYVLFTSGSTGKPKGVALEHRQVVNYVRGVAGKLALPEGSKYAHVSTFSADLGNTVLFSPLCLGGALHVIGEELVTDPNGLGDYFTREGIDCVKIVPSHLSALLSGAHAERVLPRRLVVLGGEGLSWDLVDRIERLAPELRVLNHYGPTEATIGVLTYPVEKGNRPPTPVAPLGRPLPGSRTYVLDASQRLVPIGVAGELYIGGSGVARGYLNQPEMTAERFIPDPFSAGPDGGARLYRTGDRARYLPNGDIAFLGRMDFQVKIRGYRVELGEIESALIAHVGIKDAVVLAQDDGAGQKRIVAYVVPRPMEGPSPAQATAWVAARLPDYMVPSAVVLLDALPLTPNGKIDRKALPALERRPEDGEGALPRTPVEEVLHGIWTDVFERDRIGVDERFADLGGHSLLAIQIIARARDAFQVDLPLRAIFEAPTIAGLAELVESAVREGLGLTVPNVAPAPRDPRGMPLSFAQERLWFLNQMEPDSAFYNVALHMRLTGAIDLPALARALEEVVRRHEILRTTFSTVDGRAVQIIHPAEAVPLPLTDLSHLPAEEREPALRAAATEDVQRPFDLRKGLLRTRILRISAEEHALLMTSHHIVSDAWTRGILYRELMSLYDAETRRRPAKLPDMPVQYADFAVWQRRWLEGAVYDKQMSYWKKQLEGAPQAIDLPTDRPRPAAQSYRGAWRALVLPSELGAAIEDLSRRSGVTFFMTALAAYCVVLHRYTGQDDIVVGTPVAGRGKREIEGLIGFFINTLVLRTTLSDDMTFEDLLGRVRETCLGAYAHQDMSFERLVQEISPERDLSRSPLFQVLFTMQNPPREAGSTGGLVVGTVGADNPTSKYDITLALSQQKRGLVAAVEYATDLFDQATIERMLVHYRTLLEGAVKDPSAPISRLPMMTAAEERQIVVTWNDTDAVIPDVCVHDLLADRAKQHPDAIAVEASGQEITYRDLESRANKLARYLGNLGIGPDVLVGVAIGRSIELVVAILAVLKAGGAYVPIDPGYPMDRVAFMLEDSAVPVVLTVDAVADELPAAAMMVRLDADWPAIEGESDEAPAHAATPENLAYLIYTSGSTGKPKGVMIHHRGLVNYLTWAEKAYQPASGRGAPVHSSASFDLTVTSLVLPLLAGGTVTMLPEEGEIEALVRTLSDEGAYSFVKLTPAHLEVLNQLVPAEKAKGATRAFVIGGDALTWESLEFWRRNAPETRLVNEYGPTETVVGCSIHEATGDDPRSGVVTIGRPIANTRLYVLDKHMRPAPIGALGELAIGGAGVARGYWNRPDLTAERFVDSPFVPGERLYKSGDIARIRANGDLEFVGRADDQVKIRGYRIELGEIESALAQHAAVTEAAVIAREDSPGDKRLVAYFVTSDDPAPEQGALRSFLAEGLPDYMVPSAFVRLDALPLTRNGKVDRKALPAPDARAAVTEIVAPRNAVEEAVLAIWRDVLDMEEIGVHADFFELGGHSLIATQVMGRIATSLSAPLPLQSIFEAPTIAGLAALVSEALAAGGESPAPPIEPAPRDGDIPLSFGQERLWFLDKLSPGSTLYVIPQALRVTGLLDTSALSRALSEIVRRHEALRTTFDERDGRPVQIIHDAVEIDLHALDLSSLSAEERESALRAEVAREAATPFDLARGPLFRPRLIHLDVDDNVILLTMHHIVSDAWTQGVLHGEMVALYTAFHGGRPSPLADLPIQVADHAVWQRSFLSGEVLDRQLSYWKEALGGAPRAIDLPTDRPRPAVQSQRGGRRSIALSAELRDALKELSQREGATLFMTLLAAYGVLLHRITGQGDIVVGTPIAGRSRAETEGLIGFFVNALAIRVEVAGDLPFREALARVKAACLGAYAHAEIPFERVVAEIDPERDLGRQPIAQVTFTLHNAPRAPLALPGLSLRGMSSDVATAKYDLSLAMVETPAGLSATMAYASDLFEEATIDRMLSHLQNLLSAVAQDPGAAIGELGMLSAAERQTMLVAWNDTKAPFPEDECAHRLFEEQVDRTPDAVAIASGGEDITYRALDERANRLAHALRKHGVGPESLVGVSLPRSADVVVAILATMKAGGAYVPLDPAYPVARLATMIADARPRVLVTDEASQRGLPAVDAPVLRLDAERADIEREPAERPSVAVGVESAAYVIYTSGSTGRPKGVVVTHRGLGNLAVAQAAGFEVAPGSRVLQFASTSFDASVSEILVTLLAGATLVMAPQEAMMPGLDLARLLDEQAISIVTLPPSALAVMPAAALPRLRTLVVAGEAVSEEIVNGWAVGRRFVNAYGPTEASVCATMAVCAPGGGRPSIGRPIGNVRVHVLDARGEPVPLGVSGELAIGGVGLARGYLNQPELTAERFVESRLPESPGRLYRTGDLCRYRADGQIELIGRIDQQIKLRGYRVELGEIEAVLAEQPGVREAAVTARADGSGDPRLVAYVVPAEGAKVDVADLQRALRQRLPDYMVPAAIAEIATMPLSPSGKVDKRALPDIEVGAAPAGDADRDEPRGPVEQAIAEVFASLLGVPRVGASESFFDLGGHSLLATRLVSRIRDAFGVDVPLRVVFETRTPAALAVDVQDRLRAGHGVAAPPIARAARDGEMPLSFAEERLWFLAELSPGDASYNVPIAIRMKGALDVPALGRAIADVVERHESLRTTFAAVAGKPGRVVHAGASADLAVTPIEGDEALGRAIADEAAKPFDLAKGPLFRARLFALGAEDHALALTMHHAITDGWSVGVITREIGAAYRARAAGEAPSWPALPVAYADYAAWQRGWLSGDVLDAQIAYWKGALDGAPAALELPLDRPRPAIATSSGGRSVVTLSPELSRALSELARREGATLFMTLLAGLDALLYRTTGQGDFVIGTPIAGRTRAETEGLVGCFVNTLALRAKVAPAMTFRELLREVKETCLGAYAHEDLPFERLVEEIAPERDLSRTPLFQVLFQLQNMPRRGMTLGGLALGGVPAEAPVARFDLTLTMTETPAGIVASMVYSADLFDGATIDRTLDRLRALLEGAARDPGAEIASLPVLAEGERERIASFAGVRTEYPRDATIHALFEREAARRPDAIAVVFGDAEVTYRELNRRANQLAHRLRTEGVKDEAAVGIHARRSIEMVVATIAILKAGGAYVPLDPELPASRLAFLCRDAGIGVVIAAGARPDEGLFEGARVIDLDRDASIAGESGENPAPTGSAESLAYVMYTSGSTGTPKGVCVVHRGVVRLVKGTSYARFGEDRVFLQLAPIAFDAATLEIWGPLLHGGKLVVFPAEAPALARIGEVIRQRGVTTMWLTAGLFHAMIEADPAALRPLDELLAGGEALSVPHVARALAELPGVTLINGYGPTEGTTFTCCHTIVESDLGGSIPIGRPIANTSVHILDERLAEAPIGVPGELFVGGDGLARGYLARPELTAERFVDSPFGKLYRTGDRARWLGDGRIEFLGRLDFQVKLRGYRIELGEIEALLGQHASVAACTAMLREDAGEKRIVAYVVAAGAIDVHALASWLGERVPAYMVPSAFVTLDALPLTPNGKVDRRALPAPEIAAGEGASAALRGPIEEAIAEIFAEVLRAPRVGASDGFFALGGHSLLATRAIARIRDALGVDLPLRAIFEADTPRALAPRIEEALRGGRRASPPTIVRVPRGGRHALSFAEERLWFLAELAPDDPSYVVPVIVRLGGEVSIDALAKAIAGVVRRHEVLRTTYEADGGEPFAVIHDAMDVALVATRWEALSPDDRAGALRREIAAEARRPFDLAKGPLLRARLFEITDDDRVLLLTMHHIVADAWAVSVLTREIAQLYQAFAKGLPSPLPELPLQVVDHAAWQRAWLSGETLKGELGYWRDRLEGAPSALDLPADRPRPATASHAGELRSFTLSPALTASLEALARREGATLFMTLLAAFEALLFRTTGQGDLVIGTPIVGRARPETEGLMGLFLNTLALRTQIEGELSFHDLVARVKETCLGAYAHADLPFEKLVAEISPARDLSRSPIFQVLFTLHTAERHAPGGKGAALRDEVERGSSKFDLSLAFGAGSDGLRGTFEYATDLFDRSTIERMIGHLVTLLEGVARAPETRLSELPILPASERALLVEAWNDTRAEYPRDARLSDLVTRQAARKPDAIAASFEGRDAITYADLDRRSNQLARHLRARGAGEGTRVGVAVDRGIAMLVGLLGILKAGAAYVPLDPTYPRDRLAFMASDADLAALVTERALVGVVPVEESRTIRIDDWAEIEEHGAAPLGDAGSADSIAYVIYTSGSTGKPKGVEIPHRAIVNFLTSMAATPGLTESDRLLAVTSLSFDIAGLELWLPLVMGAYVEIASRETAGDGAAIARRLAEGRISVVQATPTTFRLLLDAGFAGDAALRVLVGGEAVPRDLVDALAPRVGAVWNMYGPTETTIWSCIHPLAKGAPVLIGKPIANTQAYVLDARLGLVPIGVPGELFLGGDGVARGYLGRPELTAERFVDSPFGRLYRTGDLARWREGGALEFLGRMDFQVKVRGFRIELGEIESALAEHAGVREAVVIAREESPGDVRLAAYVTGTASAADLRAHLRDRLPDYMMPAAFVAMDRMPLTANNKIDRRALPAPEAQRDEAPSYDAPVGPVAEGVAAMFAEVLKIERVGARDGFFDLGGHSLLAAAVIARIRRAFGVELPLAAFFEAPTVAELSGRVEALLREGRSTPLPPIEKAPRDGELALSFGQERFWFLNQLEPGAAAYLMPFTIRLSGALDRDALGRAIAEIVRRHEVLRTVYLPIGDRPAALVLDDYRPEIRFAARGSFVDGDVEASLQRAFAEELRTPFDFAMAPPIRVMLFEIAEDDHALLWTMHHIVTDRWSVAILNRELGALYEAFRDGRPSPLAELPIQYTDYAQWQRAWLTGDEYDRQLAYWRGALSGAEMVIDLPTDRPRPPVQSHRGARRPVVIPRAIADGLRALGRREGATPFMVLLAGFSALLHRYTGQGDILVGSPIANRAHAETEGLVGFFVNTLVLRARFDGDTPVRALVARVKEACLGAYAHQDMPFERLVKELDPDRDMSRPPVVQVSFALQNAPSEGIRLAGLAHRGAAPENASAQVELSLSLTERESGIVGTLEYATDLFDRATIDRMIAHLVRLLAAMATDGEAAIGDLAILSDEERAAALGAKRVDEPPVVACAHELFSAQAACAPDAAALLFQGRVTTYRELDERTNRIARYLGRFGVGSESIVGIAMARSPDAIAAMMGVLKAGGAYLPLDPSYPSERLRFMLEDSGMSALLTEERVLDELPGVAVPVIPIDTSAGAIDEESADPVPSIATPEGAAYVIYTSGSTGKPKGVVVEHKGLGNLAAVQRRGFGVTAESRVLQFASMNFDASVWETVMALLNGATLVLAPQEALLPGPDLERTLRDNAVSVVTLPPSALAVMAHAELPALRTIVVAGEACPEDLVDRWAPGRQFVDAYGPTEATVCSTMGDCAPGAGKPTIGAPIANVRVYVLDARRQPVPVGVAGELHVGGVSLARGYLHRPELTEERFVPDPFAGGRMYKTGDRARFLPDGTIDFLGRIDHQIKLRGYRVELGEIEAWLSEHGNVREAVALMREDRPGDKRLVAYVVPREAPAPDASDLRDFLTERLPAYMVPGAFVTLAEMPLGPTGKIDRKALPAPDADGGGARVAPRTETERAIAAIWEDVVGVREVGVHDDFFDLGGHSLLATQVMTRIAEAIGVELPLAALFELKTVAGLAEIADAVASGRAPDLRAGEEIEEGEL